MSDEQKEASEDQKAVMEDQKLAKRQRTQARRMFNRTLKEVEEIVLNPSKESERIVIDTFESLKEARHSLLTRHDQYSLTLNSDDEDDGQTDDYLVEPEIAFKNLRKKVNEYLDEIVKVKSKQAQIDHQAKLETEKIALQDEVLKNIQRLKNIRSAEAVSFDSEYSRVMMLDESNKGQSVIKEIETEIKDSFTRLKETNMRIIEASSEAEAAIVINWIATYQDKYQEAISSISKLKDGIISNIGNRSSKDNLMKLHKISLPSFNGTIRDYPKFKADFKKFIMPNIESTSSASYILSSCLSGEPLEKIRNVDDDIGKMWQRLDEVYGDTSKVIDIILNEIKRMKPIVEGDNKAFVEFVDVIEMGHRDLSRLNIEKEISNSQTVSLIEEKLPISIKLKWSKKVKCEDSQVQNTEKFPHLLTFLLERKRIIEYAYADLRSNDVNSCHGSSHHVEKVNAEEKSKTSSFQQNSQCLFHSPSSHTTENCKFFLSKESKDKWNILMEKKGCYSCLQKSHFIKDCPDKKQCGVQDCDKFHHPLLHQMNTQEGLLAMVSSSSSSQSDGPCILQIMSIKCATKGSKTLTTLWDSGASLCLITSRKAEELNLLGKPTYLSLIKVGGLPELTPSYEYNVPLRQENGKVTTIKAFGIEEISSEIKEINIDGVKHLFQDVSSVNIQRPVGRVDLLIGFNYAGLHPVSEKSCENLLLLKNEFGTCLGGSHQQLKEGTVNHVQHLEVYHVGKGHHITLDDFVDAENLGVSCSPACGSCKCGQCALGSKNCTIKE